MTMFIRPACSFALISSMHHSRQTTGAFAVFPSSSSSSSPSINPRIHSSFTDLVDVFDAFILDQFGVLHNGLEALEGAIETVRYLHAKKKKLIILSNTSAPAHLALAKLPKLGFPAECFVGAVTSGEEASRYVRNTYGGNLKNRPTKVLFWTWDERQLSNPRLTAPTKSFLDQCGNVEVTPNIHDADLILLHGSEVWNRGATIPPESLGDFISKGDFSVVDPWLRECLDKKLPMVCANPDMIVVTPTGDIAYMPGKIAERYRQLGGDAIHCKVFGKPDAEHFEACLHKLQLSNERHRVAHVGDSLSHDIAGANGAGIASIFVTSGIHARQLGTVFGETPTQQALEQLWQSEGCIYPTHVVPAFRL